MNAYIVCEGDFDAQLLQVVLPKELLNEVEIVAAGGLSAVKSLARSLLVRRQVPIAIVVDADSVSTDLVQERRNSIEEIVESVAVDTPIKVILAVPTIEIVFFQNGLLLPRLLGFEPSESVLELATSQPRKALEQLFSESRNGHSLSQIINQLTDTDIEILRTASVIQEITNFLQSVQEIAKAS